MAIIVKKTQHTWPYIKEFTEFLLHCRNDDHSVPLRMGINHAIVFYSACSIEGVMEAVLKAVLKRRREIYNKIEMPDFDVRKTTNILFNALEEDLEIRISRSTGVEPYRDLLEALTGTAISQNQKVKELWEGVNVLFQFRNVLAHGREISASRLSAYWIKEPWQEKFSGGYKRAEEYLFKVGLLERGFMDSDKRDLYFTYAVADHFWDLAHNFVVRVLDALDAQDKEAVDKALSEGDD